MPRRIPPGRPPPPDMLQPMTVMYGAGVSTTNPPGDDDWDEQLRRLRDGLNGDPAVEQLAKYLGRAMPTPPLPRCGSCGTQTMAQADADKMPTLMLIGNPAADATHVLRLGSWCTGCAKVVLDTLMKTAALAREAERIPLVLDIVQNPFCSKHGGRRPCMLCKEAL